MSGIAANGQAKPALAAYGGEQLTVIGIAGGTGSGKTSVSQRIIDGIGKKKVTYISHDSYYKDISHLSLEERAQNNFDHPDSLDTELLCKHLVALKNRESVDVPVYNFSTHSREEKWETVEAKSVVVVDGILLFSDPTLRKIIDIKLYVDTEADLRFIRRLERDIRERGRTTDSVIQQYMKTVRPMHDEFVEPSKRFADVIIPNGATTGLNQTAMDIIISRVRHVRLRGTSFDSPPVSPSRQPAASREMSKLSLGQ
jgi:uridine kinase